MHMIAPTKHGTPTMTYPPPATSKSSVPLRSLVLPGKTASLEDLTTAPLKPPAIAAISIDFGAGNLGETRTAIDDFGALLGHVTAGRASAPVRLIA